MNEAQEGYLAVMLVAFKEAWRITESRARDTLLLDEKFGPRNYMGGRLYECAYSMLKILNASTTPWTLGSREEGIKMALKKLDSLVRQRNYEFEDTVHPLTTAFRSGQYYAANAEGWAPLEAARAAFKETA